MIRHAALFAILGLAVLACTTSPKPAPDAFKPGGPGYPGATRLRELGPGSAVLYKGESGTCITSYGTADSIGKVIEFYEGQGFQAGRKSPAIIGGRVVRWVGTRPGGIRTWRYADIATGRIAGAPEWTTYIDIATPTLTCGKKPETSGIGPAPSPQLRSPSPSPP
jgi:hypothetical protein